MLEQGVRELYLSGDAKTDVIYHSQSLKSLTLTSRQLCDIELILNGGFAPLTGFLTQNDYDSVVESMRLADNSVWSMPITLDVSDEFADSLLPNEQIALRDEEGLLIAVMNVTDNWTPNKTLEAEQVFGTTDEQHPAVHYLKHIAGNRYLGGSLQGIEAPKHYDFNESRHTPNQLRELFKQNNWKDVVAFQTRNPLHRAHVELTKRAAAEVSGGLVIQPVVGMTKPGDIDHYTRVRCYEHVVKKYESGSALLSLLPLAMRMGGPREALWHAIIRKNFGFSHFIVGRDHAGPGNDSQGNPFYGPYDAQHLVREFQEEVGIIMVPFQNMVFVKERNEYAPDNEVAENETVLNISGTEFREKLQSGEEIESWFSYPEVVAELRKTHPPRDKQGFTIFFTGLSGAGKSTIANILMVKLLERGGRHVSLLDGDRVRQHLSSELGFSKAHRNLNILRIGYVASEITQNGGVAICAPIAPYESVRRQVKDLIKGKGGFIEVFVSTPLEVCEERDCKGLYAKARAGVLKNFTGIDDPYEAPTNPDIELNSSEVDPEKLADEIISRLAAMGYLA